MKARDAFLAMIIALALGTLSVGVAGAADTTTCPAGSACGSAMPTNPAPAPTPVAPVTTTTLPTGGGYVPTVVVTPAPVPTPVVTNVTTTTVKAPVKVTHRPRPVSTKPKPVRKTVVTYTPSTVPARVVSPARHGHVVRISHESAAPRVITGSVTSHLKTTASLKGQVRPSGSIWGILLGAGLAFWLLRMLGFRRQKKEASN